MTSLVSILIEPKIQQISGMLKGLQTCYVFLVPHVLIHLVTMVCMDSDLVVLLFLLMYISSYTFLLGYLSLQSNGLYNDLNALLR